MTITCDVIFEDNDSTEEYVKYGQLINELTRGELKVPTDSLVYFTYFIYMSFVLQHADQSTCQKNYIEFFVEINRYTERLPKIIKKACRVLSNIFFNNWCKRQNENTSKDHDLIKVAKL